MSEKDEKRLKAIKTIYGEEAYHKGSKVTYGTTVCVGWCKNRSKPDNDARVRPDAKTEFNRTVKRCSTGH